MSCKNRFPRACVWTAAVAALLCLGFLDAGCRRGRMRTGGTTQATGPAAEPRPEPEPEPEPQPAPGPGGEQDPAPAPQGPGAGEIEVEVDGEGENRDEALNDAFRKAVEKGAGVEITSRIETVDYAVAFDKIITRAQGYVKRHTIVKEKTTRWDSRITMKAIVSTKSIKDDWGQIQMVLEKVGKPTVMVMIQESVIGPDNQAGDSGAGYCSSAVESLLLEKGFNLKASSAMAEIEKRKKEAALATDDLAALKAIAMGYGADVIFTGKAVARFNGTRPVHGVLMDEYSASASIMVYKADTGDVIVKEAFDTRSIAQGQGAAIADAYKKLSNQLAVKTLKSLLAKWYFEFQHGSEIQVDLSIVSDYPNAAEQAAKYASKFATLLKGVRGVSSIVEGQLTTAADRAIQKLRVQAKFTAAQLAKKIDTLETAGSGFGVSVTDSGQHSLGVTLRIGAEGRSGGGEGGDVETPGEEPQPSKLTAEGEDVVVRAKGEGENRDQALSDALRKAVEKGAGVEITSKTETIDYAVAFDRIVSRSQGYVKKHEVIEEKALDYGFSMEIEAVVAKGKIKDDWGQIQVLLERIGRPTIMVLVTEKVFGQDNKAEAAETDYCATAIESLLIEKGFNVKSSKGLDEIQKRKKEAALASGDLAALKAMAMDFGANVVISGKSSARWNGVKKAYGADVHSYMANANVQIHKTDTGDLIASLSFDNKEDAMGPAEAITKAFKGIGPQMSKNILREMLKKWYFEFQHGFSIEIEVVVKAPRGNIAAAGKAVAQFVEVLKSVKGVDSTVERNLSTYESEARQKIEVKSKLTGAELKKQLLFLDVQGTGFSLAVTAADQNSIQVTLTLE